jgi:hypothetical protein
MLSDSHAGEGAGDGGDNEPGNGHQDCGEDANSKCELERDQSLSPLVKISS